MSSTLIVFILVVVLGIILGTTFALVRTRSRHDGTFLEPPPGATGVPDAVKEDVARHVAQLDVEEATDVTEVDEELAAAVDEAMVPSIDCGKRRSIHAEICMIGMGLDVWNTSRLAIRCIHVMPLFG